MAEDITKGGFTPFCDKLCYILFNALINFAS